MHVELSIAILRKTSVTWLIKHDRVSLCSFLIVGN